MFTEGELEGVGKGMRGVLLLIADLGRSTILSVNVLSDSGTVLVLKGECVLLFAGENVLELCVMCIVEEVLADKMLKLGGPATMIVELT